MATNRPRAVIALLCIATLCYGSVLIQPGLNADLSGSAPDDTGISETTPSETGTATATPATGDNERTTEAASTPGQTATPTPTPTPRGDTPADGETGGGSSASPHWSLLFGVGGAVAVLLGVVVTLRRTETDDGRGSSGVPSLSLPALPSLPRLSQVTAAVLVTTADGIARVLDDLGTVIGGVLQALGRGVGPVAGMLARTAVSVPAALAAGIVSPLAALASVGSDAVSFVDDGLSSTPVQRDTPETDPRATGGGEPDEAAGPEPVESVVEAWERMAERVSVRNPTATTPVEYARAAIDQGLPPQPVRRLTELFRRTRYGPDAESDSRLERARAALDSIRGGEER
ncbi:DUF4129 domain-containing protein [Halomicrobium mukohataei]|uniref:DUF4129 domain-containing protein n=1 Tax=Halomicrobium mukohataei TaxID=57705 RepID=A0A847U635_9EURY|nr:DUF4129 domain-containing protein [Halomicrobium mukohataei]